MKVLGREIGTFFDVKTRTTVPRSCDLQGLNVTSVALFGSVDTTEPPATGEAVDMTETMSVGGQSNEGSTYSAPVRQGPGGNSSLVLG